MYDLFSLPDITFPEGFLWGSATAGHQIEGDNIHSQRWASEQAGHCEKPSGKACNHYELYREDTALLKKLGHQAYRMSLEWSRLEPVEGSFNQKALDHYLDELRLLKETGLQVFLTLHHFTHPLWFEEKGGFERRENLPLFECFLEYIVPKVSLFVDSWNVINEFNLD